MFRHIRRADTSSSIPHNRLRTPSFLELVKKNFILPGAAFYFAYVSRDINEIAKNLVSWNALSDVGQKTILNGIKHLTRGDTRGTETSSYNPNAIPHATPAQTLPKQKRHIRKHSRQENRPTNSRPLLVQRSGYRDEGSTIGQ